MIKLLVSFMILAFLGSCAEGTKANVKSVLVCEFCSSVVGVAKEMLENNRTEDEITNYFETGLCNQFGSLADICLNFIENDGKRILYELGQGMDPKSICTKLRFCKADEVEIKTPAKTNVICELCELLIKKVQGYLEETNVEENVALMLERDVCFYLGPFEGPCDQLAQQYTKQIMDDLANKLDPSTICQRLRLCATTRMLFVQNSLNCTLCKLVFRQVQNMLNNNQSEEKILSLIEDRLCAAAGKESNLCKTLVSSFGPTLLQLIASKLDAEKVCEFIGMCANTHNVKPVVPEVHANPLECTACQFIVHEIDKLIATNRSQEAIINALDKVCSLVPSSIRGQCDNLVQKYGVYLVQLIITLDDPLKVCKAIQLC